jgi:hypothetical protein
MWQEGGSQTVQIEAITNCTFTNYNHMHGEEELILHVPLYSQEIPVIQDVVPLQVDQNVTLGLAIVRSFLTKMTRFFLNLFTIPT